MLQTLLTLKQNGTLKQLVQSGLMSHKVFSYIEIYLWVDARAKTTGKGLSNLVNEAEIAFNVSNATVWRSLRAIKEIEQVVK